MLLQSSATYSIEFIALTIMPVYENIAASWKKRGRKRNKVGFSIGVVCVIKKFSVFLSSCFIELFFPSKKHLYTHTNALLKWGKCLNVRFCSLFFRRQISRLKDLSLLLSLAYFSLNFLEFLGKVFDVSISFCFYHSLVIGK